MTEIYSKGELNAKAELALMGTVTPIRDKDNVIHMLDYISKVLNCTELTGEEIYNRATQYTNFKETVICGLSCSTVMGMPCVNVIFKDIKDTSFKLDSEDGVLCYVHNYHGAYDLSELGYCFFERKGNTSQYHRIG